MRTLLSCAISLATASLLTACGGPEAGTDSASAEAASTPALVTATPATETPLAEHQVRIKYCHDGDTCTGDIVDGVEQRMTIRLVGIDAPEVSGGVEKNGQPLGTEAATLLNQKVKGKTVRVVVIAEDMYHRTLGELYIGTRSVNLQMVRAGYAEAYHLSRHLDKEAYKKAQQQAQGDKKGIWALTAYQAPADFRRADRERRSAAAPAQ